jgi:hypothetical protein
MRSAEKYPWPDLEIYGPKANLWLLAPEWGKSPNTFG